jgi:hypothetical protein
VIVALGMPVEQEEQLRVAMVPGVLVDIAVARLQVAMALGAARAFEAVLHLAVTDLGVGLVIAVALLRAVMDLGVGQVIVAERLRVAMVLGTRRGLMGQRPTGGLTTTTAEPITELIIRQPLLTLIRQAVLLAGVGMPQEPRPQEPS